MAFINAAKVLNTLLKFFMHLFQAKKHQEEN